MFVKLRAWILNKWQEWNTLNFQLLEFDFVTEPTLCETNETTQDYRLHILQSNDMPLTVYYQGLWNIQINTLKIPKDFMGISYAYYKSIKTNPQSNYTICPIYFWLLSKL